jgi:hypothetical protein
LDNLAAISGKERIGGRGVAPSRFGREIAGWTTQILT